jgi:hypothetical protein
VGGGDRFDALMNYPLAEAIIGFVGGRSLNEALLRSHHEYGLVTRSTGRRSRRARGAAARYAPETNAVQLNLLDSHDTPRVLSVLGGDRDAMELARAAAGHAAGAPCVYYGDEVGSTGGKDPESRRRSRGTRPAGTRSSSTPRARPSRCGTPSRRSRRTGHVHVAAGRRSPSSGATAAAPRRRAQRRRRSGRWHSGSRTGRRSSSRRAAVAQPPRSGLPRRDRRSSCRRDPGAVVRLG